MKKDKDAMNRWSEADEATLVHTLASEKAKSNWGDNGPKKVAWTACEVALLGSEKTSGGSPKTLQSIKNRWQRIKQEFEIVKELRGLSGFGWDDAKNTVTATDEVWEAYLAPESHKRARPFRNKKRFLLYDNIAELVDSTQATGANAIRFGQTPGSSRARAPTPPPSFPIDLVLLDQSKGKNESYGGVGVPLSRRGVTDALALNQAIAPGHAPKEPGASFFDGDKYDTSEDEDLVKTLASPEPPKRKRSKNVDPKTKDKKQRVTASEGMSNVSSSMRNVADSVHAAATAKLNTPQVFAIKAIEKDEGLTRSELASAVECVMRDAEFANAYLAVDDAGVRALILRRKLEKFDSHVL
ncbi:Myb/SANT-like DNA-binding domain-containing protein [Lactarius hatsudake]|nr:Myb/SANT-like DNA-binding domain-containing protein [Lactarius hatsudake]